MAIINVPKTDTWENWRVKTNEIGGVIGDITTLITDSVVAYPNIYGQNPSNFVGNPAEFTVTINQGVYQVGIDDGGGQVNSLGGYTIGDTILVPGDSIGGASPKHDATITVTSVDSSLGVATATITGTPNGDIIAEINLLRADIGDTNTALTTNNSQIRDAINELEDVVRTTTTGVTGYTVNTDAFNLVDAINEIESVLRDGGLGIANYTLNCDATDLVGAVNEFQSELGRVEDFDPQGTSPVAGTGHTITYVDLGSTYESAVNALKDKADYLADQIGGDIAADYDGPETNLIDVLDALYASSSLGTLNATYVDRLGNNYMMGTLNIKQHGITSDANDFLLKTGSTNTTAVTISSTNQNVGIGGSPNSSYKLQVTGDINTTGSLYYNGDDTDNRYLRREDTSGNPQPQIVTLDTTFNSTVNFAPALNESVVIGGSTVATNSLTFLEWFQDTVGAMVSGNVETNGIVVTYDDPNGKLDFTIQNNSHQHLSTNITDWAEAVSDTAGYQIFGGTHNGLTATYDDNVNRITLNVNDPVITLAQEVSGSATMTNLGNTTINVTLNTEAVQDRAAPLFNHTNHTGVSATYDDANNQIKLGLTADPTINLTGDCTGSVQLANLATQTYNLNVTVLDDSHNHIASNIDNFREEVEDIVGAMVIGNSESGISVTYNDATGKLNFDTNDPVIQLSGAVTGQATMTNLGSINITTTVGSGSNSGHNHDDRYYTETESNARYVYKSGDTITGNLSVKGDINVGSGNTNSNIHFWDNNNSTWRTLFFNQSSWYVEDNGGAPREILHSGNYTAYQPSSYHATTVTVNSGNNSNSTYPMVWHAGNSLYSTSKIYCNPYTDEMWADVFHGVATSARYADLAEKYLPDADYPVGTVMKVGGEKEVTSSTMMSRAIGVISENPALMMNSELEGGVYVALKGRVPVRCIGPVSKGDELIPTSDGLAIVGDNNKVFAVALEDKSGAAEGLVECVIL